MVHEMPCHHFGPMSARDMPVHLRKVSGWLDDGPMLHTKRSYVSTGVARVVRMRKTPGWCDCPMSTQQRRPVSAWCAMPAQQKRPIGADVPSQQKRDILSALLCHVSKKRHHVSTRYAMSAKQRRPISTRVPCQQIRNALQRSCAMPANQKRPAALLCHVSKSHQARGMGRVGAIGRVGLSLLPGMWSSGNKTSVRLRTPRYRERERERGVRVGEQATEGR